MPPGLVYFISALLLLNWSTIPSSSLQIRETSLSLAPVMPETG